MSDNKKAHSDYMKAKGKFTVPCNHAIFSYEEMELLKKYGHWFEALTNGTLLPFNMEQEQFIEAARMKRNPETDYEKVWVNYIKRKAIEAKAGAVLYTTPMPKDDAFYSRDMVKNLKSTMFGVMKENHKR
jgi:uncharacterized protein YifE (UPF0438 family)